MWAVMNQPVEVRNISKTINRIVHCLHKLREDAGVPEMMMEQGFPLKVIEGRYRGKTVGALVSGIFVAVVNASTLQITWDMPSVRNSVLKADAQAVNAMMAAITPAD